MLSGNALDIAGARNVIASRPARGWPDLQAFAAHPAVREAGLPDEVLRQLSLRTRWFALETQVEHAGAEVVMSALFDRDGQGPVRLAARRWTPDE